MGRKNIGATNLHRMNRKIGIGIKLLQGWRQWDSSAQASAPWSLYSPSAPLVHFCYFAHGLKCPIRNAAIFIQQRIFSSHWNRRLFCRANYDSRTALGFAESNRMAGGAHGQHAFGKPELYEWFNRFKNGGYSHRKRLWTPATMVLKRNRNSQNNQMWHDRASPYVYFELMTSDETYSQ